MTQVTDERLGCFTRFQHDILERVIKGSLDPDAIEQAIRPLIGQKTKDPILELLPEEEDGFIVHEQKKGATYKDIFRSVAGEDAIHKQLWRKFSKKDDIVPAVRTFANTHTKLFVHGRWHLVLVECNEEFFVARIIVNDDGSIAAGVDRLEYGRAWDAEFRHRVVAPEQLTK